MRYKIFPVFSCLFIGVLFVSVNGYSQQNKVDSLLRVLNTTKEDTSRLNIYIKLSSWWNIKDNLKYGEPALQLADKLISESHSEKEKNNIKKKKIEVYNLLAAYYSQIEGYTSPKILEYYQKALALAKETNDKNGITNSINGIVEHYDVLGDFLKQLEYCQQGIDLLEKIDYKRGTENLLSLLADIYLKNGDTDQSLENLQKSLSVANEFKDSAGIFRKLIKLGEIYGEKYDTKRAMAYYQKAINFSGKYKRMYEEVYSSMGDMYLSNKDYTNSIKYYQKCLDSSKNQLNNVLYLRLIAKDYMLQGNNVQALIGLNKAIDILNSKANKQMLEYTNNIPLGWCSMELGQAYFNMGKYQAAKQYSDKSAEIMKKGMAFHMVGAEELAAKVDSACADYKSALEHYQQYVIYRDKLKGEEAQKKMIRDKMQNDYEKKAAADKAAQAQKDLQVAADKRKQVIVIWSVCGGLLLVLVFLGILFNRFRITQKQKKIIEDQKVLVEEKNKEVLDSIVYAKRLQDAILPPLSIIKKYLPESFLLYKPKDIVAGDFYWLEKAGDNFLIAACDCTGHGVPGAMVSVVCSNALNRTVKEFKITEPGKILDKVRELVLETFEKSESEVQDGMDVSLCCLNIQTKEIQWSGANNPLWYVQNGELKEVAPDKQPIGKFNLAKPFNTASLKLQKGDILYLFTDGYADQFGGPKGKKFKYKQLQEKLLAVASMSMDKQKEMLNETIESWKGSLEQVDDILIMGIRV